MSDHRDPCLDDGVNAADGGTSPFELHLRYAAARSLDHISGLCGVRLVSESELDLRSPHAARYDAKLDLHAGFPYTVPHAVAVAGLALECLFPAAPKKGLITDLDDTLWSGILGEDGIHGISWHLDQQTHIHGMYQQFVASLASAGTPPTAVPTRGTPHRPPGEPPRR